jgi:hypothetical protein
MVRAHLTPKPVCGITQVKAVGVYILVEQMQNRMTLVQWLMSRNHPINLTFSHKSMTRNTLLLLSAYRPSTLPAWHGHEHETSNDIGVWIVNSAISKNLTVNTIFSHCNIHKYTTSTYGKMHNQIDTCLVRYMMACKYDLSKELTVMLTIILWLQKLGWDYQKVNE